MSDVVIRPPATLKQQAEFLDYITGRCVMRDGATARETLSVLSEDDVNEIRAIAMRLHRMAPHENAIRRAVTGK
ncbi:MAG TPA: hypothetical protein VIU82_21785 [Bosea sp. (in: a-proteobacteria)]